MSTLCDICHARPAIARVAIVQNGQRKTISTCDYHYRELTRQIRQEVETRLAKEILGDALKAGDIVEVDYDSDSDQVKFNKTAPQPKRAPKKNATVQ